MRTSFDRVCQLVKDYVSCLSMPGRHTAAGREPPIDLQVSYTGVSGEFYLRFKGTRGVGGYVIQSAMRAIGPIISDAME